MKLRWLLPLAALVACLAALAGASVSGAAVSGADNGVTTNVKVWLGLKNSDDVGTRFDLKLEVTNGGSEGYGELPNVSGGSSGFNNAHLFTIPVTGYAGTAGQAVSVTVWVRVSCASRHTSGTARLWWNDAAANSRVEDSGFATLFLRGANTLDPTAGTGLPKKTSDVFVKKSGCLNQPEGNWKPFGTWTSPSWEDLEITPSSIDFGALAVNSSATRTVTITNHTGYTLSYTGAYWPNFGNPVGWQYDYGFWEIGSFNSCLTLDPGTSCTADFQFKPYTPGSFSTHFQVGYGDGQGGSYSDSIPMYGTGSAPS